MPRKLRRPNPMKSERNIRKVLHYRPPAHLKPYGYSTLPPEIGMLLIDNLDYTTQTGVCQCYHERAIDEKLDYIADHLNPDVHYFISPIYEIVTNMIERKYGGILQVSVARNDYIEDDMYADKEREESAYIEPGMNPQQALINYRRRILTQGIRQLPSFDNFLTFLSNYPELVNEVYDFLKTGRRKKIPLSTMKQYMRY